MTKFFYERPDLSKMLPLRLPSEEELWSERERLTSEEKQNGHLTYLDIVADLASSSYIMDQINDLDFASNLNEFLRDYQLVRKADSAPVVMFSDRNPGVIIGILRRLGENHYSFQDFRACDHSVWKGIEDALNELGYGVGPAPWN